MNGEQGENMTAKPEKGKPWIETESYQNFLENCKSYGRSKSQWIRKGCPDKKPNGKAVEAAASA